MFLISTRRPQKGKRIWSYIILKTFRFILKCRLLLKGFRRYDLFIFPSAYSVITRNIQNELNKLIYAK